MGNDYVVYIHTLKSDGRVYVGQTCNLKNRWCGNGSRYESCSYFGNAIKKYGWDAFDHEVVLDGLSKDEADVYEDLLIDQYRSGEKGFGFNLRGGGSRGRLTPESIEKTRRANTGRKMSEEAKRRMSETRTGRSLSEEHKKNIAAGHRKSDSARKHLEEMTEACKKRIRCVETGQVFDSVNDAAAHIGVVKSNISACLHGYQHTSGGYHWEQVR